jgi:WD40 repeat protein
MKEFFKLSVRFLRLAGSTFHKDQFYLKWTTKMRFLDLTIPFFCFTILSTLALGDDAPKLEGHERELYGVAYSADGSTLVSAANDRTIRVWSLSQGTSVVIKTGYGASRTASISPDGSIVTGRFETGIAVWNAKSGERIATLVGDAGADGTVLRVLFSLDGKTIAAGHERGVVRLWNATSFNVLGELRRAKPNSDSHAVQSIAFLSDDQLAVGYDNALVIWSVNSKTEIRELSDISTQSIHCIQDGKVLIANQQGNVGTVRIWNTTNWTSLFTGDQNDRSENFLRALTPIDSRVAIGVNDQGDFESFDLANFRRTNKTFRTPYKLAPGGFAISPLGKQVANYFGGNLYQIHLQTIDFK